MLLLMVLLHVVLLFGGGALGGGAVAVPSQPTCLRTAVPWKVGDVFESGCP